MSEETFLGFDFGEWKIGVAVGQTLTTTATGLCILKSPNRKPDWDAIKKLIHEWQPMHWWLVYLITCMTRNNR